MTEMAEPEKDQVKASIEKMRAEVDKIGAEVEKMRRETVLCPFVVGAAVVGATAALTKMFL